MNEELKPGSDIEARGQGVADNACPPSGAVFNQAKIANFSPPPYPHPPPYKARPRGPWGFWVTMGWMILALALSMLAGFVSIIFYAAWANVSGDAPLKDLGFQNLAYEGDFLWISTAINGHLWICLMVFAVFTRACLSGFPASEYMALKKPARLDVLLGVMALGAYYVGSEKLIDYFNVPEPAWMLGVYRSADCVPCLLFAVVVIAPLVEESFFRGFVYKGVENRLGPFWAVAFTAVPWTLIHLGQYEPAYIVSILCLGVLFGLARWKSGSIFLPLALHAINNSIASFQMILFY